MQIFTIPFEEHFYVKLNDHVVKIVTFPTAEYGNIKFGIEASRDVEIHREEIYEFIQSQKESLPENA